jgi:hypothetical protein
LGVVGAGGLGVEASFQQEQRQLVAPADGSGSALAPALMLTLGLLS